MAVPPERVRWRWTGQQSPLAEAELMEWAMRRRRQATLGAIVVFFALGSGWHGHSHEYIVICLHEGDNNPASLGRSVGFG